MRAIYNECDPFAADWIRSLVVAGELPAATVDARSIADVRPEDVSGYEQVHLFAGIGGWSLALRLAGWPATKPVWTGSCPCQPFSEAGKRKGTADERHLWPEMFRLIRECQPATIFGEQVAGKAALEWLDGVFADLEGAGYACGASDLCAASVGAPHIRQRLFWVADAGGTRAGRDSGAALGAEACVRGSRRPDGVRDGDAPEPGGATRRLADAEIERDWQAAIRGGDCEGKAEGRQFVLGGLGEARGLGDADGRELAISGEQSARQKLAAVAGTGWADSTLIPCRDGKARRISAQSGDEPLAYGLPRDLGRRIPRLAGLVRGAKRNRVGRLKGYGNAIVPEVAAEFVRAFMGSRV